MVLTGEGHTCNAVTRVTTYDAIRRTFSTFPADFSSIGTWSGLRHVELVPENKTIQPVCNSLHGPYEVPKTISDWMNMVIINIRGHKSYNGMFLSIMSSIGACSGPRNFGLVPYHKTVTHVIHILRVPHEVNKTSRK